MDENVPRAAFTTMRTFYARLGEPGASDGSADGARLKSD
jgi:hypothetical protein